MYRHPPTFFSTRYLETSSNGNHSCSLAYETTYRWRSMGSSRTWKSKFKPQEFITCMAKSGTKFEILVCWLAAFSVTSSAAIVKLFRNASTNCKVKLF